MAILKSPKREKFCQNVAKGMNITDAYKNSYNTKNMKPATINNSAYKLMKDDDITARIKELQKKAEDETIMSVRDRMKWLTQVINEEIKEKTAVLKQSSDGESELIEQEFPSKLDTKIKALDILNKMCGTYIEKVEHLTPPSIIIERPTDEKED